MADVTIANIVLQRPDSEKLASAFKEYAMQNAELVAKKELALMGIAINNAAAKGSSSIIYKPSRDFTVLQGDFYDLAVDIISADLRAAEYKWNVEYNKAGYAASFTFDWSNLVPGGNDDETPNGQGSTTDQDEEWNDLDENGNDDGESENGEPQE